MTAKVLYPGSFDPVSLGHVDIVSRASAVFDDVVVGVYGAPAKELMFDTEERVDLFRRSVQHLSNVEVTNFTGLAVECAAEIGAGVMVRGLRSGSDFEYEFEMNYMNKKLASDIEIVYFIADLNFQYVSSTLIKEVAGLGGDITGLVPQHVVKALKDRLASQK